MPGPLKRLRGIGRELSVLKHFKPSSWWRLGLDILGFRLIKFAAIPQIDGVRTVTMRDGTRLTYRLNRGDIQAFREIWLAEGYAVPAEARHVNAIVDLGANIGFTSVYLSRRLGPLPLVAVEPDPRNAAILRRNLSQNGIDAVVLEAAAAPEDGQLSFASAAASNVGRLDESGGLTVDALSVPTILERLGAPEGPKLLKLDIEGGEDALLRGDTEWLSHFDCMLAELHDEMADVPRIEGVLEDDGLRKRDGLGPRQPPYWLRDR